MEVLCEVRLVKLGSWKVFCHILKRLNYSFSFPLSLFSFFFFAEQQQFLECYVFEDYIQGGGGKATYKMLF